jgi:cellulose synthase/poly-beta-1,6-N-acetylglucosamine synthase-like glycosyltransferase
MSAAELATLVLVRLEWSILAYFLAVNSFYALLLASASYSLYRHGLLVREESRWRLLGSEVVPRISMLAPAYNEEATAAESIRGILALYYPDLEVVVINDGSKDRTMEVLTTTFDLVPVHPIYARRVETKAVRGTYRSRAWPNLVVVDKENGGKADALNVGLNVASGDLVCAMDADTLIEPDALQRMVRPFLTDDTVLAVGGTIRVANSCEIAGARMLDVRAPRNPLAAFQAVEYLRAFLFGRLGWNRLGGNIIISGAFGLFRRAEVLSAGGYVHDTVGEDMELVLRLRRIAYEERRAHRVEFVPDPVAWTEVPESLRVLSRQRDRWHRGLADVIWRHRVTLFNPRYGAMGMVAMPYFTLIELLAPVVEAVGLLGLVAGLALGAVNVPFAVLFLLAAYGYGMLLSVAALLLEEFGYHRYHRIPDRARLLCFALLENWGYRQLTVYWRLHGLFKYLRGKKDWGAMERRGLARPTAK